MKLEVIAKNLRDVIKINKSQADRIEFCCSLKEGGLTPKRWIIKIAAKISRLPINVMLRPSSKSFNYSEKDFAKMLKDATFLEKSKVNGVVFGILNNKNEIDVARMKQIIDKIPSKQKIFHKAFDEIKDLEAALEILEELKIDAVLTAAGKDINQNLSTLEMLTKISKVDIIGGGGVNFNNVETICHVVDDIHIGTAVRRKNSWDNKIEIKKINQINNIIKSNI